MQQQNIKALLENVPLPRMAHYRQQFGGEALSEPAAVLREKLTPYAGLFHKGMRVAVTAGSRGIAHIPELLREVVDFLKSCGAEPFVFPAMGSHGGSTAEGQREILRGYGITEETCGCPIVSSMETVQVGTYKEGHPVFVDKHAAQADAVIVMNRIKPHTGFTAAYGSGLAKMISIGMGKQKGADSMHEAGFGVFHERVPGFAKVILDNTNIKLGVAIIENAYDETCRLEVIPAAEILEREPELLQYAKNHMARILIPKTDVLVVQTIGKNFAGAGMDANITGTFATPYAHGGIEKQRIAVLDLSAQSEGNAFGVGLAQFTTKRLLDKIDFSAMYPNPLTSTVLPPCFVPMVLESDKLAIQAAIKTCNGVDRSRIRLVYIKNTNEMADIWLSEALWEEASQTIGLEYVAQTPFVFDDQGNLEWIKD